MKEYIFTSPIEILEVTVLMMCFSERPTKGYRHGRYLAEWKGYLVSLQVQLTSYLAVCCADGQTDVRRDNNCDGWSQLNAESTTTEKRA